MKAACHAGPAPAATQPARTPVRARPATPIAKDVAPARKSQILGNQALLRQLQAKLTIGAVDDPLEHEADAVAEHVMRMPEPRTTSPAPVHVSRKCATCEEEDGQKIQTKRAETNIDAGEAPDVVDDVINAPGQPLDATTRAFMEPRFDRDFSDINIHTGDRAAQSARAVRAQAYTVGRHLVFGQGQYAPDTLAGRQLLAHELAHVVQQGHGQSTAPIRRRWDASPPDCPAQPQDRWIKTIVVDQQKNQNVTLNWSSGGTDNFPCSTGKGHCCNTDSSSKPACDIGNSRTEGSNCTAMSSGTGYPVQNRDLNHGGIPYWTEFVPARGIALHKYAPVDGTALSHGCVRLSEGAAKALFCGVRQYQTMVQVINPARPDCANANLQAEWKNDFLTAAEPLDGDKQHDANVLETRKDLASAFGKTRPPEEYAKLTAADIPRCGSASGH